MDDTWMRFRLICKPEQSGKTFVMLNHIIRDLVNSDEQKEIVHFILCDNNLLLSKQTSARVEHDLKEYVHDGVVYIELSSHARTEYHDTPSVFQAIVADGVRNIICCTNGKRMDNIYDLIEMIHTSRFTAGKFHFNIWLDEADKFMTFIETTLRPLVHRHQHVNVELITATPQPLFQKYEYLNVLPLENTTSELYHGWTDNKIVKIDSDADCVDFVDHVLTHVADVRPGSKWFIPGKNVKKSHDEIKRKCLEKGMAVLVVNGDGLKLTVPDTLELTVFKKEKEFNLLLQEIYVTHRLERFGLAITGYLCIGRGITLMSESFMLDHAILSHFADKNEASQLAGRMKGNIKGFKGYASERVPVVYTTEAFHAVAVEWEKKSKALARRAFAKEQQGEAAVLNLTDFKSCSKGYSYKVHPELFPTFERAKKFLQTKEREMTNEGEPKCRVNQETKTRAVHVVEGYFVTSKLLKQGKTVDDLTKDDRLTLAQANAIPASAHITSTKSGSRYLVLPVYADAEAPPESVQYQVRYISFQCP